MPAALELGGQSLGHRRVATVQPSGEGTTKDSHLRKRQMSGRNQSWRPGRLSGRRVRLSSQCKTGKSKQTGNLQKAQRLLWPLAYPSSGLRLSAEPHLPPSLPARRWHTFRPLPSPGCRLAPCPPGAASARPYPSACLSLAPDLPFHRCSSGHPFLPTCPCRPRSPSMHRVLT